MKIGVLAAQGAFAEHLAVLGRLDVEAIPVRLPGQLEDLQGLIIPGGESTTISKLMQAYGLQDRVRELVQQGMPVFGTCAGMIMLAKNVADGNGVQPLRLMDITVRRNAFGRQVDSFETDLAVKGIGDEPFHAIFIRAPLIEKVDALVDVLAKLEDGTIVAARQGKILACSFHPELTHDNRLHRYFLDLATD